MLELLKQLFSIICLLLASGLPQGRRRSNGEKLVNPPEQETLGQSFGATIEKYN
jgi:hypothetical protein